MIELGFPNKSKVYIIIYIFSDIKLMQYNVIIKHTLRSKNNIIFRRIEILIPYCRIQNKETKQRQYIRMCTFVEHYQSYL